MIVLTSDGRYYHPHAYTRSALDVYVQDTQTSTVYRVYLSSGQLAFEPGSGTASDFTARNVTSGGWHVLGIQNGELFFNATPDLPRRPMLLRENSILYEVVVKDGDLGYQPR